MGAPSNLTPRRYAWFLASTALLATIFAGILALIAAKVDLTLAFDQATNRPFPSQLTDFLAETEGELVATIYIPESNPACRAAGRFLRHLRNASRDVAGALVVIRQVDPHRDVAQAARMAKDGAVPGSIVLQYGRRTVNVPFQDGGRMRSACTVALMRLVRNVSTQIRWLKGHGESAFDDYDGWLGCSSFARELRRRGFSIRALDLVQERGVPEDCDVLVVAGGNAAFTAEEEQWLDDYFARGGRVLFLAAPAVQPGWLSGWNVRLGNQPVVTGRTLSGREQVAVDWGVHPIALGVGGGAVVLASPRLIVPTGKESSAGNWRSGEGGALLMTPEGGWLAWAVEHGKGDVGSLAYKAARLVLVGDVGCARNGLFDGGGSNAEFLTRAVEWLAGCPMDGGEAEGFGGGVLLTRPKRLMFLVCGCGVPLMLFFLVRPFLSGRRS